LRTLLCLKTHLLSCQTLTQGASLPNKSHLWPK
jgi:hypothetical protein